MFNLHHYVFLMYVLFVVVGCSNSDDEVLDSGDGKLNHVPTIYLVNDGLVDGRIGVSASFGYHLQSNFPVEHDTIILISVHEISENGSIYGIPTTKMIILAAGNVQSELLDEWDNNVSKAVIAGYDERYGKDGWYGVHGSANCYTWKWDESQAGEISYGPQLGPPPDGVRFIKVTNPTTGKWQIVDDRGRYICTGTAVTSDIVPGEKGLSWRDRNLNKVITVRPAHERVNKLPNYAYYDDDKDDNRKRLLVEYPFNPYKIGQPASLLLQPIR